MFTPEKMHFLSLILLKEHLSEASELLAERRVLHLEKTLIEAEGAEVFNEVDNKALIKGKITPMIERIEQLSSDFKIDLSGGIEEKPRFSLDYYKEIKSELYAVALKFEGLKDRLDNLNEDIEKYERLSWELQLLEDSKVPLEIFRETSYITIVPGLLPHTQVESLKSALKSIPFRFKYSIHGHEAFVICVTLKEHENDLYDILDGFNFSFIEVPKEGSIPEIIESNDAKIWKLLDRIAEIKQELHTMQEEHQHTLSHWLAELKLHRKLFQAMENFLETSNEYYISGWLPESCVEPLRAEFTERFGDEVFFNTTAVDDLESNKTSHKPPTKLKNPAVIRPFEALVNMYGTPSYRGIDPTIFLAITFVFMFGMMFGDIGHGATLALTGLAFILWRLTEGVRNFGYIMFWCGLSAVVFGFLFGSIFGNEKLIEPLWFAPLENPNLLLSIGILIGIGAVNLGIVLNIAKHLISKNYKEAIFGQWGVVSSIFFWELLGLAYLKLNHPHIQLKLALVIPLLLLPLVIMVVGELLINRLRRNNDNTDEKEEGVVESLFKPAEVSLSLLTNTISFIRVGAFGLNHAALLGAVFIISNIMGGGSLVTKIPGLVVGNILVMLLEGLVVFIQCLRLEYYEFFSKFFTEQGKKFKPLTLQKEGG